MAVSAGHMGSWNAALLQMGGMQREKNAGKGPLGRFWRQRETESGRLMHLSAILEDDRSPRLGLIEGGELTKTSAQPALARSGVQK